MYSCHSSTQEMEGKDHKFQTSLSYIQDLVPNKGGKEGEREKREGERKRREGEREGREGTSQVDVRTTFRSWSSPSSVGSEYRTRGRAFAASAFTN